MRRTHRLVAPVVALVALVACSQPPPPTIQPRAVVVESPQPLIGLADDAVLPGSIHARLEADLSFRVAGRIAQRNVDMGAHVEPGSVLALLDPQDARLNLDAARAAERAATADLALAQTEAKRYEDLHARGFIGQSQLDQQVNATSLAKARLEQAQAALELAANQSRYTRLTADVPGVVTQIMAEPGNVVTPGQPVLHFAADGEREVHVSVPEGRIDELKNAGRLEIELISQPGRRYAGRVRDIDPQADSATRTHLARITIVDVDEFVQLGATASVIVSALDDGSTFRLPATALGALDANEPAVWRVVGGANSESVEPVPVVVLRYLDGFVVVSGPLAPNDRLVSAGVHRLVRGMAVRSIDRSAKAAL